MPGVIDLLASEFETRTLPVADDPEIREFPFADGAGPVARCRMSMGMSVLPVG